MSQIETPIRQLYAEWYKKGKEEGVDPHWNNGIHEYNDYVLERRKLEEKIRRKKE